MVEQLITGLLEHGILALVLGVAVWKLYTDGKADREYMMNMIEKLILKVAKDDDEREDMLREFLENRP